MMKTIRKNTTMKPILICKHICLMLSFLLFYDNVPMYCTAHAAPGRDSSTMIDGAQSSAGEKISIADTGKNNMGDSIIVKHRWAGIADSLARERTGEKRKAWYGLLAIAAVGLFWIGVMVFYAAMPTGS
jgi:hypothetical protein